MMQLSERSTEVLMLAETMEAVGGSGLLDAEPLGGFLAMHGADYSGELMWVGRATNGWGNSSFRPSDLTKSAAIFAQQALAASVPDSSSCPMRWVSDNWASGDAKYKTSRSAFWRTARRVLDRVGGVDINSSLWPSSLIWSNLYKIAPSEGGNPGQRLKAAQFEGCKKLLAFEVAAYRPRRLVFATGMDWAAPFLDQSIFIRDQVGDGSWPHGQIVVDGIAVGRFVVAPHPRGKNESAWVAKVAQAFDGAG